METTLGVPPPGRHCEGSYPTYEEWKLNKQNVLMSLKKRSYPTYEEWKRFLFFFYLFPQICSYPTYEEWKLNRIIGNNSCVYILVLILPMRNGN